MGPLVQRDPGQRETGEREREGRRRNETEGLRQGKEKKTKKKERRGWMERSEGGNYTAFRGN